ncbi:glycolate oxidase iron-sulfur subunit [Sphingopyxis sp. YF1]|uniref:glycolate oxidase subunit GlcF n=1 Tax=Sphingopyxis sp. YF1 TaxID=2482763 RepID=UPI001F618DAF|nr:glycolate oxidase subunit GlcF [Sphingopyxis sp. YF1]UNU43725.1 glycolate oxidase iron-sulfur subunit [Sphingopyxis sp. YF1]
MQTHFSETQLADTETAAAERAIRKCVHCGFCTATCPTYVLLGNELDSPRGRIYLLKEMLEQEATPTREVVTHIDRCLSCLSCTSTCPSGVDYMHLIDHGRAYIETHYKRPFTDRMLRWALARILPFPRRFRMALRLGRLARPLSPLLARTSLTAPLAAMLRMVPASGRPTASVVPESQVEQPIGRVILFGGCIEPSLRPSFSAGLTRVLKRSGVEVVVAKGEVCCGAIPHHLGRREESLEFVRDNVRAWRDEISKGPVLGIVTTASGCGSMLKDYAHLLRDDGDLAETARELAALVCDSTELLSRIALPPTRDTPLPSIAYHAPCSLQHGQKIGSIGSDLLTRVGFEVRLPAEPHLCCGSAGTYNILQPSLASQLGKRKADNLERLAPDLIVTANIGCAMQIAPGVARPVLHIVEIIDWATGGPLPEAMIHWKG